MSGPLGSSQWMYSSGGFYPYEIEQSLRLNDDDSAYLSRTPASAGNRKTWTWSGWVKRGNLGTFQTLFGGGASSPAYDGFRFTDADKLQFFQEGATAGANRTTNAVFRDASAWYHVVLKLNSTASEAVIFVNGVEQACTGASPTNTDRNINNTVLHTLGRDAISAAFYFDGYMAEVNFIDGQALDPTSFGEFKSGVWVPKAYTGTYGTNGFYLPFSDSAAIGDDLSGNGNDWTPSGLVAGDVLLDSPTNNWCVWNPLSSTATLADGNLLATNVFALFYSTMRLPRTGKWYWEITNVAMGSQGYELGIGTGVTVSSATGYGWDAKLGRKWENAVATTGQPTAAAGSVIGFAFDADAGTLAITDDGAAVFTISSIPENDYQVIVTGAGTGGTDTARANFGQSLFAYTPPAGFLPLNTRNLPDPVIDPAQDDVPADYFNTVLYTGNGTSQSITGVGFQPDWVWLKERSSTSGHILHDVVRGVGQSLSTNLTDAETVGATSQISSFDTDGFTVGSSSGTNQSGITMVGWNWLAGNGTASNTDGTITSTVSANQKAGFSIVGFAGTGATATVGHGLGVTPDLFILKSRDNAENWNVYTTAIDGSLDLLRLNLTDAKVDSGGTPPTSSVFSVGTGETSGEDMIAYCFAEVEGYSKFGSYTGNGSADGPFVWCGFRPAFVMIKRTDSTGSWYIWDEARNTYNAAITSIYPNLSSAEGGTSGIDMLSNGFKLRSTATDLNTSSANIIFMAFAESPFKYANAR